MNNRNDDQQSTRKANKQAVESSAASHWTQRSIRIAGIAFFLFGMLSFSKAASLGTLCDELEKLAKINVLQAVQRSEYILKNENAVVTDESDPAVQARFYKLCAILCHKETEEKTLNAEQKRFYFHKECDRWIDFFVWFRNLPREKRDAWLGKTLNWRALNSHQRDLVTAAMYLGRAACDAVETSDPPSVILENTVSAYEKIDESWLNEEAIDYWGRVFHPPDQLLNVSDAEIAKIINIASWRVHWDAYGKVVDRRVDGPFIKAIKERLKKVSGGIKAKQAKR